LQKTLNAADDRSRAVEVFLREQVSTVAVEPVLAVVGELAAIRVGAGTGAEELVAPSAADGVGALAAGRAGIGAEAGVEPDGSAAARGGTGAAPAWAAVGLAEVAGAARGVSQAVAVERGEPAVGWAGCRAARVSLVAGPGRAGCRVERV
jgi:hypothetical protein